MQWKKKKLLQLPNIKTKTCIHTTISSCIFSQLQIFQKKLCHVFFALRIWKTKKLTYVLLQLFETLLKVFLCHYSKGELFSKIWSNHIFVNFFECWETSDWLLSWFESTNWKHPNFKIVYQKGKDIILTSFLKIPCL